MATLELFSVGRHRPEEAVVPAGGGEGQRHCRGEGDVVVVGGEVKHKSALADPSPGPGTLIPSFPSEQGGEGQLEGMLHRRGGGVLLLALARQGEFPWFPLQLRVGRHRPEEAVVPAGGGEGQHYCRGEGDVVAVGGEAMGQL